MNKEQRKIIAGMILYDARAKDGSTFSSCKRCTYGTRNTYCIRCLLDSIVENKPVKDLPDIERVQV